MQFQWLTRAVVRDVAAVGTTDGRVAVLATAQAGVVSRGQAFALGLGAGEIQQRRERGWTVLHRGVYAVGHRALALRGRAVAALLAAGPGAVASHRLAGALWGICAEPAVPEVTVSRGRSTKRATLHTHAARTPPTTRTHSGLPLTSPQRTCLDLAEVATRAETARAIREARVAGLLTRTSLERELDASAGRRATRTMRAILSGPQGQPSRSWAERQILLLIARSGLPQPQVNHRLAGRERDLAFTEHRLVVEIDDWNTHAEDRFEADHARDTELAARGIRTVRFTRSQVRDEPLAVVAALAAALNH
jgi:hypothetical protein